MAACFLWGLKTVYRISVIMINRLIFPALVLLLISFMYLFSAITLPFLVAGVIAYALQPVVSYTESKGVPRWAGSLLLTLVVLAAISVLLVYTVPMVYTQLTKLIIQIPEYIQQLQKLLHAGFKSFSHKVPDEYVLEVQRSLSTSSKKLVSWLFLTTESIFRSSISVIHYLTMILFVPILVFYLMKDWPGLLDTLERYIPPQNKKSVISQVKEIDYTLASFARGQAMVCLILSLYYSLALHITGVDFGALIGGLTGVLAFIPYVGAIIGFSTSGIIALLQSSPWLMGEQGSFALLVTVTIIFAVGQFLEGVILSPNIVGRSLKLHPLWIMFALFFGGYFFGFGGVLVAAPFAGAVGVIVRHNLKYYKEKMHRLYYGTSLQQKK